MMFRIIHGYCALDVKDVYIPGQATYAYILRYWYLVPLIKPPWAAVLVLFILCS